MAKNKKGATAKAATIGIWVGVVLMMLVVGYTLACLIAGAVSPNMNFSEAFTTFFGVANQAAVAPEAADTVADTALSLNL